MSGQACIEGGWLRWLTYGYRTVVITIVDKGHENGDGNGGKSGLS